jgi:predicted Fe-Mo cluster-binding NifX family protein
MRIAIPVVAAGELAEEFSRAGMFALYDVHDETRAVAYLGREEVAEPGCGRSAGVLKTRQVEVVLGHRVSQNAVAHLREVGIVAIQDAPILTADALIAHLVTGTLQATPPAVEGAEMGGCQSHGCGHCGSHGQADGHMHEGEKVAEAVETGDGGCGGHGCGSHGCAQP